jgi:alpha-acetolactate decarboxylase
MKHPAQSAHELEEKLQAMHILLTESNNDEKSAVVNLIKECQDSLTELRSLASKRETKKDLDQRLFCDNLTVEFSVSSAFSDSYTRSYECMVLDMKTLKALINIERTMQNINDDLLFARVTITNNDPESDI